LETEYLTAENAKNAEKHTFSVFFVLFAFFVVKRFLFIYTKSI